MTIMKRIAALLLILSGVSALAVTTSGTKVNSGTSAHIPMYSGQICFATVNCTTVTNGAFGPYVVTAGVQTVTVKDNTNLQVLQLNNVNITGSTWVFDQYVVLPPSDTNPSSSGRGSPYMLCAANATYQSSDHGIWTGVAANGQCLWVNTGTPVIDPTVGNPIGSIGGGGSPVGSTTISCTASNNNQIYTNTLTGAQYFCNGKVWGAVSSAGGGPPTGAASGDLGSTYPGPTVTGVNGAAVPTSAGIVSTNGFGQFTGTNVLAGNVVFGTGTGVTSDLYTKHAIGSPTSCTITTLTVTTSYTDAVSCAFYQAVHDATVFGHPQTVVVDQNYKWLVNSHLVFTATSLNQMVNLVVPGNDPNATTIQYNGAADGQPFININNSASSIAGSARGQMGGFTVDGNQNGVCILYQGAADTVVHDIYFRNCLGKALVVNAVTPSYFGGFQVFVYSINVFGNGGAFAPPHVFATGAAPTTGQIATGWGGSGVTATPAMLLNGTMGFVDFTAESATYDTSSSLITIHMPFTTTLVTGNAIQPNGWVIPTATGLSSILGVQTKITRVDASTFTIPCPSIVGSPCTAATGQAMTGNMVSFAGVPGLNYAPSFTPAFSGGALTGFTMGGVDHLYSQPVTVYNCNGTVCVFTTTNNYLTAQLPFRFTPTGSSVPLELITIATGLTTTNLEANSTFVGSGTTGTIDAYWIQANKISPGTDAVDIVNLTDSSWYDIVTGDYDNGIHIEATAGTIFFSHPHPISDNCGVLIDHGAGSIAMVFLEVDMNHIAGLCIDNNKLSVTSISQTGNTTAWTPGAALVRFGPNAGQSNIGDINPSGGFAGGGTMEFLDTLTGLIFPGGQWWHNTFDISGVNESPVDFSRQPRFVAEQEWFRDGVGSYNLTGMPFNRRPDSPAGVVANFCSANSSSQWCYLGLGSLRGWVGFDLAGTTIVGGPSKGVSIQVNVASITSTGTPQTLNYATAWGSDGSMGFGPADSAHITSDIWRWDQLGLFHVTNNIPTGATAATHTGAGTAIGSGAGYVTGLVNSNGMSFNYATLTGSGYTVKAFPVYSFVGDTIATTSFSATTGNLTINYATLTNVPIAGEQLLVISPSYSTGIPIVLTLTGTPTATSASGTTTATGTSSATEAGSATYMTTAIAHDVTVAGFGIAFTPKATGSVVWTPIGQ